MPCQLTFFAPSWLEPRLNWTCMALTTPTSSPLSSQSPLHFRERGNATLQATGSGFWAATEGWDDDQKCGGISSHSGEPWLMEQNTEGALHSPSVDYSQAQFLHQACWAHTHAKPAGCLGSGSLWRIQGGNLGCHLALPLSLVPFPVFLALTFHMKHQNCDTCFRLCFLECVFISWAES